MPPLDNLVAFAVASVVLVLIPGPSVLFVVSRAIAHGRRAALGSVVGNSAGVCVVILLVAFGLGSLVERSVLLFTAIKLAGAAYLVYLGVRTFRERGRLSEAIGMAAPVGVARHVFRQGFVVGLTNPKTLVFFGAVLPQFVDREAGGVPVQMVVLGMTFVLAALVLDSLWGIMAGTARTWLARSPRRLAVLGGTGGLTMIGLGVGLAVTGRAER